MINLRILNPRVLSLLARVRHTNALVIADRGFPFWPEIETVDLSLVDGVPTVLQVLAAIRRNFVVQEAFMAAEFLRANPPAVLSVLCKICTPIPSWVKPDRSSASGDLPADAVQRASDERCGEGDCRGVRTVFENRTRTKGRFGAKNPISARYSLSGRTSNHHEPSLSTAWISSDSRSRSVSRNASV